MGHTLALTTSFTQQNGLTPDDASGVAGGVVLVALFVAAIGLVMTAVIAHALGAVVRAMLAAMVTLVTTVVVVSGLGVFAGLVMIAHTVGGGLS